MQSEPNSKYDITQTSLANIVFKKSEHLKITRQSQRGEIAVIVLNTLTNQQFSTTPLVESIIECFSQKNTLKNIIENSPFAKDIASDEWLDLLTQLVNSETLSSPELSNDELKFKVKNSLKRKQRNRVLYKPWMIKIPLINPNKVLNTINKHSLWLWHPVVLLAWAITLFIAIAVVFQDFDQLHAFWQTRFLSPRNLALAFLAYIFLKTLHELGHGLAAKRWGAEVIDAGIIFIFFIPMPYIDVSHSATFPSKRHRLIVSASGMIFELFIASCALLMWKVSDSLFIKELCINIMIIGALSSVLFNANPLLKFDGYYILSDLLEISNLSQRSMMALRASVLSVLFRLPTQSSAHSIREHRILCIYGFLSLAYRLLISLVIASYIASQYLAFGLVLGIWLIASQIASPIVSFLSFVITTARQQHRLKPVILRIGLGSAFIAFVFFIVPISQSTNIQGMLTPSSDAVVTSNAKGFITKIHVKNGQSISEGEIILSIENQSIDKQLKYLAGQLDEYQTFLYRYSTEDPSQADYYRNKISALKNEQKDLLEQQDSLSIRSPSSGIFLSENLDERLGSYINKGENLGVVSNGSSVEIIALVNEKLVKRLEDYTSIEIWVGSLSDEIYTPKSVRKTPAALSELPSKYFGLAYGGNIELDSQNQQSLRPLQPTYQIGFSDFNLNTSPKFGSRAHIKFVHSRRPLASQLGDWLVGKLDELGITRKF